MTGIQKNPIKKIARLLLRERQALAKGEIEMIADIHEQKLNLLKDLEGINPQKYREDLLLLASDAQNVDRLYGAALKGLEAAVDRIRLIREPASASCTYDSRGNKASSFTPLKERRY